MKTIQISDNLHKRIKMIAAHRGLKIVDLIREGIEYVLLKHEEADYTFVSKEGRVIKEYFPGEKFDKQ